LIEIVKSTYNVKLVLFGLLVAIGVEHGHGGLGDGLLVSSLIQNGLDLLFGLAHVVLDGLLVGHQIHQRLEQLDVLLLFVLGTSLFR
jgi:hypothetical protein